MSVLLSSTGCKQQGHPDVQVSEGDFSLSPWCSGLSAKLDTVSRWCSRVALRSPWMLVTSGSGSSTCQPDYVWMLNKPPVAQYVQFWLRCGLPVPVKITQTAEMMCNSPRSQEAHQGGAILRLLSGCHCFETAQWQRHCSNFSPQAKFLAGSQNIEDPSQREHTTNNNYWRGLVAYRLLRHHR